MLIYCEEEGDQSLKEHGFDKRMTSHPQGQGSALTLEKNKELISDSSRE